MRILMSGASGLIGKRLGAELSANGHEVTRLVRKAPRSASEVQWDITEPPVAAVANADVVVNLSGAGVGDRRWSAAYEREILTSRVSATTSLARAIAEAGHRPAFISMSATGFYGASTGGTMDENSPAADTFLASVCQAWEAAADPARQAGARVVHPRLSMVLDGELGALPKLVTLYRLGLGGPLGGGKQRWPWISSTDAARALQFLIAGEHSGVFNLTTPNISTNADFNRELARALKRPAIFPVPGFALKIVLGGFGDELLADQPIAPRRLQEAGFTWQHPTLAQAFAAVLA